MMNLWTKYKRFENLLIKKEEELLWQWNYLKNADDSIVRNIQPQFKTEEEPVINENTETDLEK